MWDCTGAVQLTYDLGGTAIAHNATARAHDVAGDVSSRQADCATPRVTARCTLSCPHLQSELICSLIGPAETITLALSMCPRPDEMWVRTSTEERTMQVAGAMLGAMGAGDLTVGSIHATVVRACLPSLPTTR